MSQAVAARTIPDEYIPKPGPHAHIIRSDAEAIDEATHLAAIFRETAIERDQQRRLPVEEVSLLSQRGLMALTVPEKYGGQSIKATTLGEVIRIISAADPSIGQIPQNHYTFADALYVGTPEQEEYFWRRILAGDRFGNANSEATRKRPRDHDTRAERVSGGYRVAGRKYYTTGAAFAHWVPVIAKDNEGNRMMLMARRDAAGLTVIDDWRGMGQRTTASGTTILANVFVPDEHVFVIQKVWSEPEGAARVAGFVQAAIDVGIAEEAMADLKNYIHTKNRPWIDNPFDEHAKEPFIVRRFGELQVKLHASQALLRRAGEAIDESRRDPVRPKVLAAAFAVADLRIFAGETAVEISSDLFELTGARATLEEYDLDRHWRNARTHSLHDPFRWKAHHIGNYYLNGVLPPPGTYVV